MRLRRPELPILLTISTLALVAPVAGCDWISPVATPECDIATDGQVVRIAGADCELPAGVTVQPSPTPTPAQAGGDSDDGILLFITYACATCHALSSLPEFEFPDGLVLDGIGAKGADYIRESILNPSAEVVEGYEDGLMPQDYSTQLTTDELDTLVSFLSSQ